MGVPKEVSHEIKKYKYIYISHHLFSNVVIVCVTPISSPSNTLYFITIDHIIDEMVHLVTTVQIPPW